MDKNKNCRNLQSLPFKCFFFGGLGLIYSCPCGRIPYLCNRRLFSTLNVSITKNLLWPLFRVLYRASKTRHYNSIDESLNPTAARSMCWFFKAEAKLENPPKAFGKCRGAYHIGSKSKISEARERKEQRKKSKNRRLNASNNRRKRACIIFRSLGGEPDELCYEPHIWNSANRFSRCRNITFIHTKNRQSLSTRSIPPSLSTGP